MSKQAEKRIALAKEILNTTDPMRLEAVEIALAGNGAPVFTEAQVVEFERFLERYERGEEKATSWSSVKRRLAAKHLK